MDHSFSWLLSVIQKEHATKEELRAVLKRVVERLLNLPEEEAYQWTQAMYYLVLLIYHRRPPDGNYLSRHQREKSRKGG